MFLLQEGKTGKIVITEFQEQEVEALLTFLYGGGICSIPRKTQALMMKSLTSLCLEIDMKKSFPKDNMYVALIKLWKLADFFCLDFLRTIVNKARIWHTTDLACQLCSISGHSNFDTVTVVEALRVLYTTDTGGARTVFQPALVNLAVAGCKILSKDVAFQALLKDSHDFAADWATKLAVCLAKAEDLVVPVHRRTYCFAECYQKLESDADGFFDPVSWNNQGVVMPVCRKCMLASFRAEGEESD